MKFAARIDSVGLSMIRQIMMQARGCANLGIGEPQFLTPAVARQAAREAFDQAPVLYTPNAGMDRLCRAVLDYHGCPEGHAACITNGSQEALFDLLFAITDPGDEILVPDPGYVAYATIVKMAGGTAVPYPLPAQSGFQLDVETIRSRLGSRTKAVLVNSPSNPTGQILEESSLQQLAALLRSRDVVVISDEIYSELFYGDERPPSLSRFHPETVVLSGVSKMASMTGWRLGWICGPEAILSKVTVMHQYTSSCASSLAQRAALAVLTPPGMEAVRRRRRALANNRERLMQWAQATCGSCPHPPQGAFYMMLPIAQLGHPSLEVALELLGDGVATIPGAAFGDQGEGFLRISFAAGAEELETGLTRLARGLKRLGGTVDR